MAMSPGRVEDVPRYEEIIHCEIVAGGKKVKLKARKILRKELGSNRKSGNIGTQRGFSVSGFSSGDSVYSIVRRSRANFSGISSKAWCQQRL